MKVGTKRLIHRFQAQDRLKRTAGRARNARKLREFRKEFGSKEARRAIKTYG